MKESMHMPGIESGDARLVGAVLLTLLPLLGVEAVGYTRGGYDSQFWALPLDEKLDHIAQHRRDWLWISVTWLAIIPVLAAGLVGFAILLAQAGEGALAGIGLGAFLVGALGLFVGMVLVYTAMDIAARARRETGDSPAWLQPIWTAAYWTEGAFIFLANLAYVAWGAGMLSSDFPSNWAGFLSVAGGIAIIAGVLASRQGFQHLGVIVPVILGIALVVS